MSLIGSLNIKQRLNLKRFFEGEGPQHAPYTLRQRQVYILPTRQGIALGIILFTMLIGSINYTNNLGYIVTFLLASVTVVSIFHTYNTILNLTANPVNNPAVFARQECTFKIQLVNAAAHPRLSLEAFSEEQESTFFDIDAHSSRTVEIKHYYEKRGLLPLPRVTLQSRFPLGLFYTWSYIELDQHQLVYPLPSDDKVLPQSSGAGQEGEQAKGQGTDEFQGLRDYYPGDPMYKIHWKSSAKHRVLHTKTFMGYASKERWLDWHDSHRPSVEEKISQLTRWVLLADQQGIIYGLRLPGCDIQPSSGLQHRNQCLTRLALFGTDHDV